MRRRSGTDNCPGEIRLRGKIAEHVNAGLSTDDPRMLGDRFLRKMDGYFMCDELAVLVHRLRELICHSQAHTRIAFLSSADDILSELLETIEREWTTIEEIARGLKT
jgi:hypothetical protein